MVSIYLKVRIYLQNICGKFFGRRKRVDGPVTRVAVGRLCLERDVDALLVGSPLQHGRRELPACVRIEFGCKSEISVTSFGRMNDPLVFFNIPKELIIYKVLKYIGLL